MCHLQGCISHGMNHRGAFAHCRSQVPLNMRKRLPQLRHQARQVFADVSTSPKKQRNNRHLGAVQVGHLSTCFQQ